MRYPNRDNSGRDEVKVAVIADQMRVDKSFDLLPVDLLWSYVAIASAVSLFLMLH